MRLDAEDLMEDKKINVNKPKGTNNSLLVVGIAIIVTIAIICILFIIMQQLKPQGSGMKTYVDGKEVSIDSSVFVIENDKVYVNVKGIAKYIGYDSHSGEYKIEAQDSNKVFVENKQETASMFLDSTVISKTTPNINDEYKNYEMSEPAREINGDIYVIADGIRIACNTTVVYDATQNTMNIKTLDYYYSIYNKAVQDKGFKELSDDFENKKAILYNRLVVRNADDKYGVINSKNEEIIGTRYGYIQFDEYNQEFTITNSYGKVGIDDINGETKISVKHDEIKSINKNAGLYLIKSNDKYGVINNNEAIIIHAEYDEIGVDLSDYSSAVTTDNKNNSKKDEEVQEDVLKQYVFFESIIPVKQNGLWGFFDVKGTKIGELKYTGIGCVAKNETANDKDSNVQTYKKTTSNLLSIDEYELVVVEKNGKYGLVDINAKEVLQTAITDMYSITNAGVKTYYMEFNGGIYNLETDVFSRMGLQKKNDKNQVEQ